MNNLKNFAIKQINEKYDKYFNELKTDEGLIKVKQWFNKTYKKNEKDKLYVYIENRRQKEIKEVIEKIDLINSASDFTGQLIITIEWKKSKMWGSNPKVYTNYGFIGSSIGGWGYDKLSTATAQALNNDLRILKIMFLLKNEELNHRQKEYKEQNGFLTTDERGINHFLFGYGSGYNVLPCFEGGVGVSCHERIINKIGLKWENITSTENTDVFLIRKRTAEELKEVGK